MGHGRLEWLKKILEFRNEFSEPKNPRQDIFWNLHFEADLVTSGGLYLVSCRLVWLKNILDIRNEFRDPKNPKEEYHMPIHILKYSF